MAVRNSLIKALGCLSAVAASLVFIVPTDASASASSRLTVEDQQNLSRILGHTPSFEETNMYLDQYGRVPTTSEINAYLKAEDGGGEQSVAVSSYGVERTAVAGTFGTYFQYGKWINRGGVVSLSLMPKSGGIGNYGSVQTWNAVYQKFHLASQWTRHRATGVDASMKKQYLCHFKYGMLKTPWNLEPHKKAADVSSINCN
ncbi:DUF2599 domain-containing protein [Nanchangia anserum]|uniref:DUF2599 domain-containing protein n=1 Tax=Nanchangia anserum TaxID=2692125 RepID=A0A8I0GBT0_9ACTO|nr:DUF2599 domain-containing protein [Nanchangia anserum]MBD3689126.1 DUF2599 domain-containing protein [Nanchangia anserum]QOX81360.1 DUF2599 domain-containing protein [Nanchangia anserum]